MHVVKRNFGGRELSIETGRLAKQANGSVMVRYGDSVVLVAVTGQTDPKPGASFFPLTVDYQEKFYSAGKIPGGFFKREGRPSLKATLTARLIDRPIRPLFPAGYQNETQIIVTTLSVDLENAPDVMALIGASAALEISNLPFFGPIAGCRVGRVNKELIINPLPEQMIDSDLDLLVAASQDSIVMVEGGSLELSEDEVLEALKFAHKEMQPIIEMQLELKRLVNPTKIEFQAPQIDIELKEQIKKSFYGEIAEIFAISGKQDRTDRFKDLKKRVIEQFSKEITDPEKLLIRKVASAELFGQLKEEYARTYTVQQKRRIDGRSYDAIRNISCEVGVLPRVHGSAVFTRGETQVLVTTTLGTGEDEQRIDSIESEESESFMLHYNFPPFSVGETGPLRGPGRREIGHGALAQRSLAPVIPTAEQFPYTIRVVSDVLESNGSSSMASVCGGTLALLDAGVPVKSPVAGIAMGLILEEGQVAILSDILGDEDHLGDMDFKVAGTEKGVTGVQMDIKIGGVTFEIMERALRQAREGRLFILSKMNEVINQPRADISKYAPRIQSIPVAPDKIGTIIGPGGKMIRAIIEATGVKIDIDDAAGTVQVASSDPEGMKKAVEWIEGLIEEPEIGKEYEGKVCRIADFGAFVTILHNKDGLVHISELAPFRIDRVTDVVKLGDHVKVKVLDIDEQGKVRLSRKACLTPEQVDQERQTYESSPRRKDDYERQEVRGRPPFRGGRGPGGGSRGPGGGHRGGGGGSRGDF